MYKLVRYAVWKGNNTNIILLDMPYAVTHNPFTVRHVMCRYSQDTPYLHPICKYTNTPACTVNARVCSNGSARISDHVHIYGIYADKY